MTAIYSIKLPKNAFFNSLSDDLNKLIKCTITPLKEEDFYIILCGDLPEIYLFDNSCDLSSACCYFFKKISENDVERPGIEEKLLGKKVVLGYPISFGERVLKQVIKLDHTEQQIQIKEKQGITFHFVYSEFLSFFTPRKIHPFLCYYPTPHHPILDR
jgi:hypothetical protein